MSGDPRSGDDADGAAQSRRQHRVAIRHMILGFVVLLALLFVISLCTLPGR